MTSVSALFMWCVRIISRDICKSLQQENVCQPLYLNGNVMLVCFLHWKVDSKKADWTWGNKGRHMQQRFRANIKLCF